MKVSAEVLVLKVPAEVPEVPVEVSELEVPEVPAEVTHPRTL